MNARSRYQCVNRGRKDRPYWYVEDEQDNNRVLYTSRSRAEAFGHRDMLRRLEREQSARNPLARIGAD